MNGALIILKNFRSHIHKNHRHIIYLAAFAFSAFIYISLIIQYRIVKNESDSLIDSLDNILNFTIEAQEDSSNAFKDISILTDTDDVPDNIMGINVNNVLDTLIIKLPDSEYYNNDVNFYKFYLFPEGGLVSGKNVFKKNGKFFFCPSISINSDNLSPGNQTFTYRYNNKSVKYTVKILDDKQNLKNYIVSLPKTIFYDKDIRKYPVYINPGNINIQFKDAENEGISKDKNGKYFFTPSNFFNKTLNYYKIFYYVNGLENFIQTQFYSYNPAFNYEPTEINKDNVVVKFTAVEKNMDEYVWDFGQDYKSKKGIEVLNEYKFSSSNKGNKMINKSLSQNGLQNINFIVKLTIKKGDYTESQTKNIRINLDTKLLNKPELKK